MLRKIRTLCAFGLFVCLNVVFVISWAVPSAEAHGSPANCLHRDPTHNHCTAGRETGTGSSGCKMTYDVTFRDAVSDGVFSDGSMCPANLADYCDGFEKVIALTGSGDGFRFDTNKSANPDRGFREVCIDLTPIEAVGCFQVDLRFSRDPVDGTALDICSLAVTESGNVGLDIEFLNSNGEVRTLSYVTDCWQQNGDPDPAGSNSQKVQVKRTGAEEWEIETVGMKKACLRNGFRFAPSIGDIIAPFKMTITAQN